jgi:hypothetical protein
LWLTEPVPDLLPCPDPGSEWRDPVLRDPITDRVRGRGPSLPDAAGHAVTERGDHAAAETNETSSADCDPDARTDARANAATLG